MAYNFHPAIPNIGAVSNKINLVLFSGFICPYPSILEDGDPEGGSFNVCRRMIHKFSV